MHLETIPWCNGTGSTLVPTGRNSKVGARSILTLRKEASPRTVEPRRYASHWKASCLMSTQYLFPYTRWLKHHYECSCFKENKNATSGSKQFIGLYCIGFHGYKVFENSIVMKEKSKELVRHIIIHTSKRSRFLTDYTSYYFCIWTIQTSDLVIGDWKSQAVSLLLLEYFNDLGILQLTNISTHNLIHILLYNKNRVHIIKTSTKSFRFIKLKNYKTYKRTKRQCRKSR